MCYILTDLKAFHMIVSWRPCMSGKPTSLRKATEARRRYAKRRSARFHQQSTVRNWFSLQRRHFFLLLVLVRRFIHDLSVYLLIDAIHITLYWIITIIHKRALSDKLWSQFSLNVFINAYSILWHLRYSSCETLRIWNVTGWALRRFGSSGREVSSAIQRLSSFPTQRLGCPPWCYDGSGLSTVQGWSSIYPFFLYGSRSDWWRRLRARDGRYASNIGIPAIVHQALIYCLTKYNYMTIAKRK